MTTSVVAEAALSTTTARSEVRSDNVALFQVFAACVAASIESIVTRTSTWTLADVTESATTSAEDALSNDAIRMRSS